MSILPTDFIQPTSITLIRGDRFPVRSDRAFSRSMATPETRIRTGFQVVSLVATTSLDPDRSRLDVTTSASQMRQNMFSKNPVPRGRIRTDHSMNIPDRFDYRGFITETPFIQYTAGDADGLITRSNLSPDRQDDPASRVQASKSILDRMFNEREPISVYTSIGPMGQMGIAAIKYSKNKDTGVALEVSISLQQIFFGYERTSEVIADTLIAQMGLNPIEAANRTG